MLIFSGQGLFYITTLIMLTNTIEYGEYMSGERNESILFSLRPFMAKMSSALQQGIVALILIISGLYGLAQQIADFEELKALNQIGEEAFKQEVEIIVAQADDPMKLILRIGMTILPLILITLAFLIIKKKYIIDEETYRKMVTEIESRKANKS